MNINSSVSWDTDANGETKIRRGINLDLEQGLNTRRVLDHGVGVRLVLDLETLWQIETFFKLTADLHDCVFVVTVARPHS